MKLSIALPLVTTLLLTCLPVLATEKVLELGKGPLEEDYNGFIKEGNRFRYKCPTDNFLPRDAVIAEQYRNVILGYVPEKFTIPPIEFYQSAIVIRTMCLQRVRGTLNDDK